MTEKHLIAVHNMPIHLLLMLCVLLLLPASGIAADVIVVGDTQLKPVGEIIAGIRQTIEFPFDVYDTSKVKGRLRSIVADEDASVVIALGKDAIEEAYKLPLHVAVIYDLVVKPPYGNRPNTTGFYMATPVRAYLDIVGRHLQAIKQIAVIGSPDLVALVEGARHPNVKPYRVNNPVELLNAVSHCYDVDAILLLPDVSILTTSAIEDVFLISYRKGIPILGVSEKQVKQGGLFALVFEPQTVGRQIGERASVAAKGMDMGLIQPSPSRQFDLFINLDTAERMGISVPEDLAKKAKRVYP